MERMLRWREPAVVVVGVALLLRLVLVVVFAAASTRLGLGRPVDAADLASRELAEPVTFVVLAGLVLACHLRPVTRHAHLLTVLALVVAGVALLLALVLGLTGYSSVPPFSQLDLAVRLLGLVPSLLAVGLLAGLVRRPVTATRALPGPVPAGAAEEAGPDEPAATGPDPALEPTWQPDEAAGAAWYTAGDAARGRPAAGWGGAAEGAGWSSPAPLPVAPEPAPGAGQEPRRDEDRHAWERPSP